MDKNTWLPRRQLEEMGFGKMVDAVDAREAAAAGLHSKPLTAAGIAKHLELFGLEPEFSLHSRIKVRAGEGIDDVGVRDHGRSEGEVTEGEGKLLLLHHHPPRPPPHPPLSLRRVCPAVRR